MAIVIIDCGNPAYVSGVVVEAWKHGVEVERLSGSQLELSCGRAEKIDLVINKYPVKILHEELAKLVDGQYE